MSNNVTISRELLQDLIDFAEHYSYADDYFREKYNMDAEFSRLAEQVQAILDTPAPAADTVTYMVKWQGRHDTGVDAEGIGKAEAADMVQYQNKLWLPDINHWAVGTDGSIIGYVGAPK